METEHEALAPRIGFPEELTTPWENQVSPIGPENIDSKSGARELFCILARNGFARGESSATQISDLENCFFLCHPIVQQVWCIRPTALPL